MAFILLTTLAFALVLFVRRAWYHPRFLGNKKPVQLPPGSMGWPYIGETFKLYSQNPNVFLADKQKRYGDIFKTHVLGCPCIMIASPEAAKFVLASHAHQFKPTFPASKERMLGPQAIFFHLGDYHARLRRLVLSSFLPGKIRSSVVNIESIALHALDSWEGSTINTFQEMKRYAFEVGLLSIFGTQGPEVFDKEELKQSYYTLEKGYNSMPLNLPGTPFNKAMKARKRLSEILSKIIAQRRSTTLWKEGLLETLISSEDESSGQRLTDDQISDNIIGVIFASQDTTASVLTWIVKYLSDHAGLLEAVTAEQEAIHEAKGEGGHLTWADTKKMPLTSRVIQETLRIATILSFTFREAVEDVEYKGYLIPKGWKVMPLFRNIHHSPDFYPDPHKFDPSRFEVPPRPNTFLPFGNGAHSCPGSELAKLEILILIHHLTTKYRWHILGSENGIQYGPFPVPKKGLPIKVSRKNSGYVNLDKSST